MPVGVSVGVLVGVSVGVCVGVFVGVLVGDAVGVCVVGTLYRKRVNSFGNGGLNVFGHVVSVI